MSVKVASAVTAPVGGWMLDLVPDGPGDWGGGDIGYGVQPGMTADVPATEGSWTVNLLDENRRVVAHGRVTVVADKHVPLLVAVK